MAELELLEERLISGRGVIRRPAGSASIRYLRLAIDVVRERVQPFDSNRFSPPRARHATLVFLRQGYVVEEQPLDYKRRLFEWISYPSGQTLIAVKCAYEGILQTFENLGSALVLAPFRIANNIEDYTELNTLWAECQIVCEPGTALQVRLYGLNYDDDCDSHNPFTPPPPSAPLPQIPPGTAIGNISDPYEDDQITQPDPLDSFFVPPPPLFPVGNECQRMFVSFQFTRTFLNSGATEVQTIQLLAFGTITGLSGQNLNGLSGQKRFNLSCRGSANAGFSCQPPLILNSTLGQVSDASNTNTSWSDFFNFSATPI